MAYDSDKGRQVATAITALMTGEAYYAQSARIARDLGGPFAGYNKNETPFLDKSRTGRLFDCGVMDMQNWTLVCNARWRLTDEQLAILWHAECPNSRSRCTIKNVRTVRSLFNQGRRNNDRPGTPVPDYDPGGNPVVFGRPDF